MTATYTSTKKLSLGIQTVQKFITSNICVKRKATKMEWNTAGRHARSLCGRAQLVRLLSVASNITNKHTSREHAGSILFICSKYSLI
jgi:hypothetical protein